MKKFLGVDRTPPAIERSLSAASKLKSELPIDLEMGSIPLEELSSLVEDIHVKTREASQNIDVDMRQFLRIDTKRELLNNTSKLTEFNKRIKRDTKTLDPTYTDEQRQLYRDRLDDLNTEKQTRLEILSQNQEDLQTQVARVKQIIEKVIDQNTSFYTSEGAMKKWLGRLADVLKRLVGKAVEALPAISGSGVGAVLNFLEKAVGFVAEHTWP